MDSSVHGDAFPAKDFSSEFRFGCAFGFDGEFDFGFGGDFNFLSAHESGFGGSPLGDDRHLGAVVVAVFIVLIAIFKLRVSRSPAGTSSFSSLESRVK
jgi:hypothetical protein